MLSSSASCIVRQCASERTVGGTDDPGANEIETVTSTSVRGYIHSSILNEAAPGRRKYMRDGVIIMLDKVSSLSREMNYYGVCTSTSKQAGAELRSSFQL